MPRRRVVSNDVRLERPAAGCGGARRRAAAGPGRRRQREDRHARPPGGPPAARGRRPRAAVPGDLQPAGGPGAAGAGPAACPTRAPPAGSGAARSTRWPTGSCASTAGVWASIPGSRILDSGDVTELFGLDPRRPRPPPHVRADGRLGGVWPAPALAPGVDAGVDLRPGGQHRRAPAGRARASRSRGAPSEAEGIRASFEAYVARKRERQLLDYDDLLLCWRALGAVPGLLAGHVRPRAGRRVPGHQRPPGRHPGRPAAPTGAGLTVVGDDAQAIYGFRAASSGNMLDFPDRFPGTTIVRLEQNYRSTPPILAVANAVMAEAAPARRRPRSLWSDRHRHPPAAAAHLRRRGWPRPRRCATRCWPTGTQGVALHDQAVLFRASSPRRPARAAAGPPQHPVREVRRAASSSRRPTSRT